MKGVLQQNKGENLERGKCEIQEMAKSRSEAKESNGMMVKDDPKMTTEHQLGERQTKPEQIYSSIASEKKTQPW